MMPDTVLLDPSVLANFFGDSVREYESSTPELPPRCWAILLGRFVEDAMTVERVRFARNIRESDHDVLQEFHSTIIPRFGACYANGRRGFWCEPKELHRITREAEAEGLEVLGSIHLHPDWHRIGPPHERGLRVSQEPTPMDRHLFCGSGWPLNMILYLEQRAGRLHHSLGAWAPPLEPEAPCRPLALRLGVPWR
jgi:proteasome lid subunit RPN8/RPN11